MATAEQNTTDWWKRWPSLHDAEMAAFAARGATVRELHERHGLLILEVDWPLGDGAITLKVGYSPYHPFCRPAVSSNDLRLARHQHPHDGGLCLLVNGSAEWHPHQRVADLIGEQLPKILEVNTLRAAEQWHEAALHEEQAPDPLAVYYAHDAEPVSAVYFGEPTPVPDQTCGIADVLVNPRGQNGATDHLEAILQRVKPLAGTWLTPPFNPANWIGKWSKVPARWVRLARPLPRSPEELLAAAEAEIAKQALINPAFGQLRIPTEAHLALTAIVFDDEVAYGPNGMGNGWLFLASRRTGKGKSRKVSLVRGFGISEDMFSRVPVSSALRDKNVLLIGCGAIGSFAAVELARAGIGKLTIFDHDIVEPGNSIRWPLGRSVWGLPKVAALRNFLAQNYPSTQVEPLSGRLGASTTGDEECVRSVRRSPRDDFRQLIMSADLVVDTTASTECQMAIAHECREIGRPLVIGYATEGVAGGIVARFRPEASACWICLNEHWEDHSIELPPANPTATVLPIGCNAPTFTGGSFDLQEVSLEVVRSAIGLLAPDVFDPGDWDWSSLGLVGGGGRRLPTWSSGQLDPHMRCCAKP